MAAKRKHIVVLTSEFPPLPGGIGNHSFNLAEHLQVNDYRVSVIADQRASKEKETAFDAKSQSRIYRVSLKRSRSLMYLKRIWLCFKLARTADILICSGKFPLWIGAVLKPVISAQIIAIIHGTEVNFKHQRLRQSIDASLVRYDKIIVVSNFTKSLVEHLNLKSIRVIPNGFTMPSSSSDSSLTINGFPKLLTVGNVTERKGQTNVIRHLPVLIEKYPNVHYHCVGFKTEIDDCLALAKSLNVLKHITFHGHVSYQDLICFYTDSDICVMLSQPTDTGDVEGFGIALLEANHFGLPTIGAKGCGIEDAISHGESGLLVEPNDSDAFFNAVTAILEEASIYTKGAVLWAEAHQWQYIIKRYIDYIEA